MLQQIAKWLWESNCLHPCLYGPYTRQGWGFPAFLPALELGTAPILPQLPSPWAPREEGGRVE